MASWYSNPFAQFALGVAAGAGAIVLVSRRREIVNGFHALVQQNTDTEVETEAFVSQIDGEGFADPVETRSHTVIRDGMRLSISDRMLNSPPDENRDSEKNNGLVDLLFQIAKDQAHRESFIHRGITCNMCNASPVCGTRYKCANCLDYDLCEVCEPADNHDRTHVFLKIMYPVPPLANPKTVCLKPFYTGMFVILGRLFKSGLA